MATSLRLAIVAVVLVLCEGAAYSQGADADALFRRGKALLAERKLAQACDAFDASNRLKPGAGILVILGACREQNQQLASAWSAYRDALGRAKSRDKINRAKAKVAALEPRLSYLTIAVPDAGIAGLTVTRDGEPLTESEWNRALPVDGGDYVIAVQAPGRVAWQTTAHVPVERGKIRVKVPELEPVSEPLPSVRRSAPQPVAAADAAEVARPDGIAERTTAGTWSPRRKLAIVAAATSVVAVGVGAALGVSAENKQRDARTLCPDPRNCVDPDRASDLNRTGHRFATGANVAFGVGAAGVIAAGVLWLTGKPESRPHVSIALPAHAGAVVVTATGSF